MNYARKFIVPFALCLMAGAIILGTRYRGKRMQENTLVIALMGRIDGELAPENISTIPLYHVHYNLWDRLLGSNGNPAIAKSFTVSHDQLTYTFFLDEKAKFSNGRSIHAEDIKFSIERLIRREKNGHINAKGVIGDVSVISPSSLSITLKEPTPSFIFLVSSPEFGIVPHESCDPSGNIINLDVTSGAYRLERFDLKNQKFEFAKNATYQQAELDSPGKIILLFKENGKAVADSVASEEADFYELYDSSALQIIEDTKNSSFRVKVTNPSFSTFLVAKDTLSSAQAKYIGYLFRREFTINFESDLEKRSAQILPAKSFSSLDEKDLLLLKDDPVEQVPLPRSLTIQARRTTSPLIEAVKNFFSPKGISINVVGNDYKGPVHFAATGQGMNLDFPEIELNLALLSPYAYIGASEESKSRLRAAIHETEDSKRAELLKSISRDLLRGGQVIPCTIRSYVHIFNKKRIDADHITNYDGDVPFFKIRML